MEEEEEADSEEGPWPVVYVALTQGFYMELLL